MQAVIFGAMFSGAISVDENTPEFVGYPRASWVSSLKMGTETALSKANFLRTTKVETMQAFIMYMVRLFTLGLAMEMTNSTIASPLQR